MPSFEGRVNKLTYPSVLLLVLLSSLVSDAFAQPNFTGKWQTTYGVMTLRQTGDNRVTGQYDNGGTIGEWVC